MEAFQNKQSKRLLGISKYANNSIALAELGWFPLQNKIIISALKYCLRLKYDIGSPLLLNALNDTFKYKSPWSLGITDILTTYKLNALEKNVPKDNVSKISSLIKNLLEKDYLNTIQIKSTSNPNLRGYIRNHSDVNYRRKEYLTKVDNQTHRNTVTKLRTGKQPPILSTQTWQTTKNSFAKFVPRENPKTLII